MGGVLFIGRGLLPLTPPENERDYRREAIEILLQVMENNRDDLWWIFAGLQDRWMFFYQSNPGLSSRWPTTSTFPDYSAAELLGVAKLIMAAES